MKNRELQLQDKEYDIQDILRNYPIDSSIIIMELDGSIVFFNKDAVDLINSLNENTLKKSQNFIHLFQKDNQDILVDKIKQVNNNLAINFLLKIKDKQSIEVYLEIQIRKIAYKRSIKHYLLVNISDQTVFYLLENKLRLNEVHLNTAQLTAKIGSWEIESLESHVEDWRFTYFSKEAQRLWGFDDGDIPVFAKDLYRNMLNDDGDHRNNDILKYIKTKQNFEIEHKVITKDGELRYICEKGDIIYDKDVPIKIIGTCQDVTEKTDSFLNLKLYKEKLKAVFDSSFNDHYLLLSPLMEVMFFNKNMYVGLYKYYGKTIKVGDQINDIINPADLDNFHELLNKCLNGESSKVEFKFKPLNYTSMWLEVNLNPVYSDNILIGISINIIDITIKKNDEIALIKKNKALRDYAFYTSHKLRAPLSNILGISLLIDQMDTSFGNSAHLKELVKNIHEEAQVLDQIVHHLNNIVSITHPKIHKNKLRTTDLHRIILIDDDTVVNIINTKLFKKLSKEINCYVFTQANEALSYLLNNPADLILLDINMPIMNGWQFLEEMKKKKIRTEVLMVSSSIDPEDLKRAMSYENVFSFLSKPIKIEDLKELII